MHRRSGTGGLYGLIILLSTWSIAKGSEQPGRPVESPDHIWQVLANHEPPPGEAWIRPAVFLPIRLSESRLRQFLSQAPPDTLKDAWLGAPVLTLPMPNGGFARFGVLESPIMAPGLSARYPQIRTYFGQGIDDRAATVRFDCTPQGFHAQILSPQGAVYIDPI